MIDDMDWNIPEFNFQPSARSLPNRNTRVLAEEYSRCIYSDSYRDFLLREGKIGQIVPDKLQSLEVRAARYRKTWQEIKELPEIDE